MINFRYHLASLIAVFLALGVGVVMGSTIIQEGIVSGLRNRIDTVEANADATRAENQELSAELDRRQEYIEQTAPYAVSGRLPEQPLAIIAARGIDEEQVDATVAVLRQAGAAVPGVLWVEPAWSLQGTDDAPGADELAAIVGADTVEARVVRAAAIQAIAERVAAGPPPPGGTDVLAELGEAGFVTFEGDGQAAGLSEFPAASARALVLWGPASEVSVPALPRDLSQALVSVGVLTTVGEVWEEVSVGDETIVERGTSLALVRDDDALSEVVSTVDDIDLVEGKVAAALALADLGQGVVGHYGSGPGADAPVPPYRGA